MTLFAKVLITHLVVKKLLDIELASKKPPVSKHDFDARRAHEAVQGATGLVRNTLTALLQSIEASLKLTAPKNVVKKVQNELMTWPQIKDLTASLPEMQTETRTVDIPAGYVAIMANSDNLRFLGVISDLVQRQREADLLGPNSPKKKRKIGKGFVPGDFGSTPDGSDLKFCFQHAAGKLLDVVYVFTTRNR